MIRVNKLAELEGTRNADEFGENGKFGKSGNSDEMIRANKLTQLEEPQNVGKNVAILARFHQGC